MLLVVLIALAILGATALGAAVFSRSERVSIAIGTGGALVGCALGAVSSVVALAGGSRQEAETTFSTALGPMHVGIDPLSAFFLLCIFAVSGLGALYGAGYVRGHIGRRNVASLVAFFNLLVAAMATIVIATDALVFLMGWEAMSIASFFLVTFESDREDVRRAGWIYLVASHLGFAVIFFMFMLLGKPTGQIVFSAWTALPMPRAIANACFVLALVGFGAKAGLWPLHVWLPEAHPAAPSHVSSVMSGVMIKMGIYGILRTLDFLGQAPAWWGALVLALGAVSAVLGVLSALAQHDLKRLLAYHSVENVGIITMGIGLGMLGKSANDPTVAFLGFAGALLHTLNHGIFKGLLFQAAGSVLHATGTVQIDRLGGLARRMPRTAIAFLVGAVAISGLPPLNGFVSEWLLYVGALRGAAVLPARHAVFSLALIGALALVGGLASACFVKAFGVVFLGEARSDATAHAHEAPVAMTSAMWAGAIACAGIGVFARPAVRLLVPVVASLTGHESDLAAIGPLAGVVRASAALGLLVLGLVLLRGWLLRGKKVTMAATWGCGYASPTARMQYTGASFAQLVVEPFVTVFHRQEVRDVPKGVFPDHAAYEEHLSDRAERVLVNAVGAFAAALAWIGVKERARLQLYLAYVLATLVALLAWLSMGGAA
jgi:hydrogenase-4 component B